MDENNDPLGEGETVYATEPQEESSEDERGWPDHTDPEWLKMQHHIHGRSTRDMGEIVDRNSSTILYHMNKHGIDTRDKNEAISKSLGGSDKLRDGDWLREKYIQEEKSSYEIAELCDVSSDTVLRELMRQGIETRDNSESQKIRAENQFEDEEYNDEDWLKHQYITLGKSPYQISDENGWHHSTVDDAIDRHGIRKRGRKSAQLNRYKKTKCDKSEGGGEFVSSEGIDASWRDIQDRGSGCYIQYRDPKWLKSKIEGGATITEIVKECEADTTHTTIRRWLDKFGIEYDHDE